MPIIETPDSLLPLSQGDVLRDVRLFLTRESWAEAGGDCLKLPHKLCLVISRPCIVGHKPNVITAAIERYTDRVPRDVQSFEDILAFLTELRDGAESPDVFYLGQLPGHEGRYGPAWTRCTRSSYREMPSPSASSQGRGGSAPARRFCPRSPPSGVPRLCESRDDAYLVRRRCGGRLLRRCRNGEWSIASWTVARLARVLLSDSECLFASGAGDCDRHDKDSLPPPSRFRPRDGKNSLHSPRRGGRVNSRRQDRLS